MEKKTILIAEDQPDSRQLLEDILERFQPYGVSIHSAADGKEALNKARQVHPDLILLDVMMPGMSGYEVCEQVREDPDLKDTYIIMVSAKIQPEDRRQAAMVGADEYVTKPYDMALIIERVQSVLGVNLI
ncbi:MAG: response regulator [Chloroflexi bacterium]|nr:response regulator [Chloroflexota bacterium]